MFVALLGVGGPFYVGYRVQRKARAISQTTAGPAVSELGEEAFVNL